MALQPQHALGGTPWSSLASSGVVWEHHPHTVDAVISDEHKIVYIDNVKAGSTTLRSAMIQVLHASWNHGDCCAPELSEDKQTTPLEKERGCHHGPSRSRTTTRCLNATHDDYFHFSFVRHPVSKFESGVRQAWYQSQTEPLSLANLTADELLDKQLDDFEHSPDMNSRGSGPWINEHLQPNTYRLTGFTHEQTKPVRLDFVGLLEDFDAELGRAADLYDSTTASSTPCAAAHAAKTSNASNTGGPARCGVRLLFDHLRGASGKSNSRAEVKASELSDRGVAKLCASDVYVGSSTPSNAPLAAALGKYECKKPQSSRAVTLGVSVDGDPAAEVSHES